MTQFADPSTPTGFDLKAHLGALLLIEVIEYHPEIATTFGPSQAISCNIAVLDGEHKGDTAPNAMLFPKVLVSSLKSNVGQMVVGRLTQGVAKPGQSAPWTLTPATPDEKAIAARYVEHVAKTAAEVESPF